ncbi:ImpE family T6SS protein Cts1E [Enterobacter sp. Ap-916]|uniref:type VI secretion system accessory protein TagJ n=1 Tax=unclassified Enterobacter TaxID=2608935 RepID=UPI0014209CA0|nr:MULTISPECIES: type VI secretion system accessory protein TagJ [unclassified Enterobacter]NIF59332.1 ImpE family T6SS protein Cts1E [Enterobacter sp. Ap-867]NIG30942.1 ImpE family T6SS protein Cts1E [Enterobacter sp. Ap-916]
MMQDFTSLTQALKNASLNALLEQVLAQVKTNPQDLKAREVLFKLYCVEGSWDKALLQLQTLALLDDALHKQTELYKNLVFSEMQRLQVLTGERQAATLQGEMPLWMEKLHQANVEHYQGQTRLAALSRDKAFELAPESAGQSDTLAAFKWIADSDGRLGPVCEFICAGGYRWLPFASIQTLSVSTPGDLLDLIWLPATIKVADEVYHGYIPARYPVEPQDDQQKKLGLKTEWITLSEDLSAGTGRKVLVTDISDRSIMEVGDIVFE